MLDKLLVFIRKTKAFDDNQMLDAEMITIKKEKMVNLCA